MLVSTLSWRQAKQMKEHDADGSTFTAASPSNQPSRTIRGRLQNLMTEGNPEHNGGATDASVRLQSLLKVSSCTYLKDKAFVKTGLQGHSLGTHLHLQGVALLVGECHSCPGQWSFVVDHLVMLLKIACNLCLMESDSSQAVSLANPETLVKTSKEWVPLFISYAAAKSTAAEDTEGDDTIIIAIDSLLKKGEGVSVVSAIGGRYSLEANRPKFQLSMFLRSNNCCMEYCIL